MKNSNLNHYLVLGAGVISVSFAAILIRLTEAPAPVVAFYRLALAAVILAPITWTKYRKELEEVLNRKYLLPLTAGGFFLAAHFLFWITSLDYTTVASSVVFVSTQPIFVALGAFLIFRRKTPAKIIFGIVIAILGSIIIGASDLKITGNFFYGDMLALTGAVMIAAYYLIASRLRKNLHLIPYVFVIYSTTALFLLFYVLIGGYSLSTYGAKDFFIFLLLAVGPNVIGHTCLNWAIKYVSPSVVSASILGEPIGSTLLAVLILGEIPPAGTIIGGTVILCGIYITARADYRRKTKQLNID
ncbi:MAG: DMT family transporter [Halanaerobiaceae bacterium]